MRSDQDQTTNQFLRSLGRRLNVTYYAALLGGCMGLLAGGALVFSEWLDDQPRAVANDFKVLTVYGLASFGAGVGTLLGNWWMARLRRAKLEAEDNDDDSDAEFAAPHRKDTRIRRFES